MSVAVDRDLRVFIAEDNSADVYLVEMALQEHGLRFQLLKARDGEEALRNVVAFDGATCPDIALLDQNLPRHDGDKVMEAIRQHEHCGRIPIIIMSSTESRKDQEAADRFGAIFFRKATNLSDFLALGALVKDLVKPAK
jgi:CheY-like chemotaxis protein